MSTMNPTTILGSPEGLTNLFTLWSYENSVCGNEQFLSKLNPVSTADGPYVSVQLPPDEADRLKLGGCLQASSALNWARMFDNGLKQGLIATTTPADKDVLAESSSPWWQSAWAMAGGTVGLMATGALVTGLFLSRKNTAAMRLLEKRQFTELEHASRELLQVRGAFSEAALNHVGVVARMKIDLASHAQVSNDALRWVTASQQELSSLKAVVTTLLRQLGKDEGLKSDLISQLSEQKALLAATRTQVDAFEKLAHDLVDPEATQALVQEILRSFTKIQQFHTGSLRAQLSEAHATIDMLTTKINELEEALEAGPSVIYLKYIDASQPTSSTFSISSSPLNGIDSTPHA